METVSTIRIHNNSGSVIMYLAGYDYPDTTIPDLYHKISGIKAGDSRYHDSEQEWELEFSKTKAGKMSFFFFAPDTIIRYGWDKVRSEYRILARKDITLEDLKKSNYQIFYP